MRAVTMVILCLLAILSTNLTTYSEPVAQDSIIFAAPVYGWPAVKTPFLLGSFKAGLKVTLMDGKDICTATTGAKFQFEHMYELIDATYLIGNAKCTKGFVIAVVGANPETVQIRLPEEFKFSLPKSAKSFFERSPRWAKLLASDPKDDYSLESPHPRAFRVGRFTLLKFSWKGGEEGPALLLFGDNILELEGDCTGNHTFFSVNQKLYLAYHEGGCFNGRNIFYVYDLSGTAPNLVYCDGLSTSIWVLRLCEGWDLVDLSQDRFLSGLPAMPS